MDYIVPKKTNGRGPAKIRRVQKFNEKLATSNQLSTVTATQQDSEQTKEVQLKEDSVCKPPLLKTEIGQKDSISYEPIKSLIMNKFVPQTYAQRKPLQPPKLIMIPMALGLNKPIEIREQQRQPPLPDKLQIEMLIQKIRNLKKPNNA